MAKGRQKELKVIIDEDFYYMYDGRCMTLYHKGEFKGYYSRLDILMQRFIELKALSKAGSEITFNEYLESLISERKKIEQMFAPVLNP